MKLPVRVSLSILGVLALFGSAAFTFSFLQPPPDASRAGRSLAFATRPVAFNAALTIKLAETAPVVVAPGISTGGIGQLPVFDNTPLVMDHPGSSTAADVIGRSIQVFDSAGAPAPSRTLSNPTHEGFPLVLLVKQNAGEWLRVQIPVRPNETFGWVRASDVTTRTVPNHIVVELGKRRLSAFNGSQLLMETAVGIGTPKTPTPTGRFYVDISIKNPGGAYGRHMLSVAGFSNVLKSFGTGIGQVAIHGTNNPASVGQYASHGCMRLSNEAVLRLASLAPTGTPVFILP